MTEGFVVAFIVGAFLYGSWILVDKAEEAERRKRVIVTDPPTGESMMEKVEKDRAEFDARFERLVVAVENLAIPGATQ